MIYLWFTWSMPEKCIFMQAIPKIHLGYTQDIPNTKNVIGICLRFTYHKAKIYLWYTWDIHKIYLRYTWFIDISRYIWDILEIYQSYTSDIPEKGTELPMILLRNTWDSPEIYLRYVCDMHEIYTKYIWDIPEIYLRYT